MHDATPALKTSLAGLELANPVILAAGTAGTLDEMSDVFDLSRVGGVVTKSITPLPRDGNQPWRVVPVEGGMLNAVGLANPGVEAFVRDYGPRIAGLPTRVIGSVAGFSVEDYVKVAAAMNAIDAISAVELNVSCPNVHKGCEFASDPELLSELIREVRRVLTHTRLFVKLSPIPTGKVTMTDIARAAVDVPNSSPTGPCKRPGADALCIANTTPAMAIDVRTRRPRLGRGTGGLSGPAVHPMAVRLVYDVFRNFASDSRTPIVGIGGVLTWEDAAEFILAGATAVEVGTGLFVDPRCPIKIVKGLEKWVRSQGCEAIAQLVGAVEAGEGAGNRDPGRGTPK
jgi:dihydroorotate dehydrogenase (NAD+) catalytic subunit